MSIGPIPAVRLHRFFPVPVERVWRAWTDPDVMKLWFGSDPAGIGLAAQVDLQVGGGFEVAFQNSDGSRFTCLGEYRTIQLHQSLIFTWSWGETPGVEELVSVRLEAADGGTRMSFEHAHIDPRTVHGYEAGWASTFDKLARVLA